LNQTAHPLLQWFAARGTVGKEMAMHLQKARYVLWFNRTTCVRISATTV
jgi:hypothetical protein